MTVENKQLRYAGNSDNVLIILEKDGSITVQQGTVKIRTTKTIWSNALANPVRKQ